MNLFACAHFYCISGVTPDVEHRSVVEKKILPLNSNKLPFNQSCLVERGRAYFRRYGQLWVRNFSDFLMLGHVLPQLGVQQLRQALFLFNQI